MKTRLALPLILALVGALSLTVMTAVAETPCERAAAIRKHVAEAEKMPDQIKKQLTQEADELCPEKQDFSDVLKKAEEMVAAGKFAEALDNFQKAMASEDKKVCKRAIDIARKLKADGKENLARSYFEAGLSGCDDAQALKEYKSLPVKQASALEAKGKDDLISKEVIIESLRTRPEGGQGRAPGDVSPDRGDRFDRYDRYDRPDRHDRYDRPDRRGRYDDDRYDRRPFRRTWTDDEYTPKLAFPIQFESGSARLTERGRRQLDQLGMAMEARELGDIRRFFVDGHTDSLGDEQENCDLAYQRAEGVIRYLVDRWNVHPRRLVPRSFGETCPVAPNYDEEGRHLNRRVELRNADMARGDSRYSKGRCH